MRAIWNIWPWKNSTGIGRHRKRRCLLPLTARASCARIDKQRELQGREGGEGIINIIQKDEGSALESHSYAKGNSSNTQGYRGWTHNSISYWCLALPSNMILSETDRGETRIQSIILSYWPLSGSQCVHAYESVCVCACGNELKAMHPVT